MLYQDFNLYIFWHNLFVEFLLNILIFELKFYIENKYAKNKKIKIIR